MKGEAEAVVITASYLQQKTVLFWDGHIWTRLWVISKNQWPALTSTLIPPSDWNILPANQSESTPGSVSQCHRLSQSRANEQGVKENQTGWKRKHSGTKTSIANPFCIWQTPKQCELWLETMKSSFLMPLDKYLISRSHGGGFIVCKANVEDNKEEIRNSNFRQAEERWFEWAGTMFVGADRPAWVFQKLLIHWDFSGLTENGLK